MSSFWQTCRVLVAGYGLPAEFGIATLFGLGLNPERVAFLTDEIDQRNAGAHAIATLRGISTCTRKARTQEAFEFVAAFQPDLILSLHYRYLIPDRILQLPRLGGVNLHPSLLPAYRGTNSVQWVLINGESQTGFTYHFMDPTFDNGAIIHQEAIDIEADGTAFSLFHKLVYRAMMRLEQVVCAVAAGERGRAQVGEATYFPRRLPFEGMIDPSWSHEKVERFIRAMYFPPFAPASLLIAGEVHPAPDMETFRRLVAK